METGLDYFLARYYSSTQGRFLSPDWSESPSPVPYAIWNDPQSMNLYTYVRNEPVARVDADGHCDLVVCITMKIAEYVAAHTFEVGTDIKNNRREYNQRIKNVTSEERKVVRQQMQAKDGPLARAMVQKVANDPERLAKTAAKTPEQLAESAGRANARVNAQAETAGKIGKVGGVLGIGIATYNIATAPEGQKLQTAAGEAGGLSGAIAGGELGASIGSAGGPIGAAIGGVLGAIGGGFAGEKAINTTLDTIKNPRRFCSPNCRSEKEK